MSGMNARAASAKRRDLVLGVALVHEGVGDQATARRGELRHRHPQQPADLEDAVVRDPAVAELAHALGRLDVELGVHRGVVGRRHPERPPLAAQELLVDPRPLGDLGGGEPLLPAAEHPLHRQQRQPVLRDRGAQLVEGTPSSASS